MTRTKKPPRERTFSRAFDRTMWVLTLAALAAVVTALVQAFRGEMSWGNALAAVVLAGFMWLVLAIVAGVALEGRTRPRPPSATHPARRGLSSVPHQRGDADHPAPTTLKGRATIPASSMMAAPPSARHLVVLQAMQRAVDDAIEQAVRARLGLCWETTQVSLHTTDRLDGWVVLVEVEVAR